MYNVLTALSLLLCVLVAGLWARSCFVEDYLVREVDREVVPGLSVSHGVSLTSSLGGLSLRRAELSRSGDPDAVTSFVQSIRSRRPLWTANGWWRDEASSYPAPPGGHTAGFAWASERDDQSFELQGRKTIRLTSRQQVITIPYWFPAALTGWAVVPTGIRFRRWVRRRRHARSGRCAACGYDLTGNVSGVCPECGNRKVRTDRPRRR